jgi:type III secretion system-like peptide-binding chaperone
MSAGSPFLPPFSPEPRTERHADLIVTACSRGEHATTLSAAATDGGGSAEEKPLEPRGESDRRTFLRNTAALFIGASAPLSPRASDAAHKRRMWATVPAEEAWRDFETQLARALGDLEEDQFLIVSKKRTNRFTQFCSQGRFGMRVEATANAYLRRRERLMSDERRRLTELGWRCPTLTVEEDQAGAVDGSPNFFRDVPWPVPFDEVAALATATLRQVFRARHPGELEYHARSFDGHPVRFPSLRLRWAE